MIQKYLFIILCFCASISACIQIDDCPSLFELPTTLTPIAEEYKIGDTITIESKFSKNVLEFKMEQTFDMEGIMWSPAIALAKIDSIEVNRNSQLFVDLITDFDCEWKGNVSGSANGILCKYQMINDSFTLVLKLIPKQVGLFSIQFLSSLIEENEQDFPGKCKLNFFEGRTRLNGDHDANIHLLEDSPTTEFNQMLDWGKDKKQQRFYEFGHYICRFVD